MSAYGEFKASNVAYVSFLFVNGYEIVDFDETRIYPNALKAFDILEKEATEDVFGEGDYDILMTEETFDEKGRLIKVEWIKHLKIRKEAER